MPSHQRLQLAGFFILLLVCGFVVFLMWAPLFRILAFGFILSVLFIPIYRRFLTGVKHEAVASFLTVLLTLFIVIIPLYFLGQVLFGELVSLYNQLSGGGLAWRQSELLALLPPQLESAAMAMLQEAGSQLSHLVVNLGSLTNIVSWGAGFFFDIFLTFFTMFYLLKDGSRFRAYLGSVFPLAEAHENLLVNKLENAINGVIGGQFVICLVQGAVATVGFLMFGVPQPFLWGAFTVLAAFVPTVGTSLSLIPAVLYLFFTGHLGAAVGMAIWAALAVGLIDNLIAPRFIGSRVHLHPLLTLLGVVGGIGLFGFLGFLLGPIIVAIFVTLMDIYRSDLKVYLEK
ncbi:MAG TPA: AI-2E family transporter [Patescibacteria group bacterium]|nr:AI-2E family transporter [Patescibacteria group bacterium]